MPGWTTNLAAGLDSLYWKLPPSIRGGYGSWSELWDSIKDSVKKWATDSWTWITGDGSLLKGWYDNVGIFVSDFKEDPAGTIKGLLGETWRKLVTFTRDCLTFYYNLWGSYRQTLADLVADPLGYLWDRAEQFLVDKW
ncbi:hypothetical protein ES708_10397 [subsurface metagenome]